jgi:hypothetical protein
MQTSSYSDINKMKKKKEREKTPIANHTARTPHIFQSKNRKGEEEEEEESLLLLAFSSVFPSGFSLTRGSNPTNGSVIKTQKLN